MDWFDVLDLTSFVILWLLLCVGASIIFRITRGKPIFHRAPDDAIFHQRYASGRSLKNFLTAIGGAKNCLTVTVTSRGLEVMPIFPFTLFFLPEIYDLEFVAPGPTIRSAELRQSFLRTVVHVEVAYPEDRAWELHVRNPEALLSAIAEIRGTKPRN